MTTTVPKLNSLYLQLNRAERSLSDKIAKSGEWQSLISATNNIIDTTRFKKEYNIYPHVSTSIFQSDNGFFPYYIRLFSTSYFTARESFFEFEYKYGRKGYKRVLKALFDSNSNLVKVKDSALFTEYYHAVDAVTNLLDKEFKLFISRDSDTYNEILECKIGIIKHRDALEAELNKRLQEEKFYKKFTWKLREYFAFREPNKLFINCRVAYDSMDLFRDESYIRVAVFATKWASVLEEKDAICIGVFKINLATLSMEWTPYMIDNSELISNKIRTMKFLRGTVKRNLVKAFSLNGAKMS